MTEEEKHTDRRSDEFGDRIMRFFNLHMYKSAKTHKGYEGFILSSVIKMSGFLPFIQYEHVRDGCFLALCLNRRNAFYNFV